MSAPKLRRSLLLEQVQAVPDGLGGQVESWVGLGRLWAEVVAGSARDDDGEETVLSSVGYRITVRGAPVDAPSRPRADQRFRDGSRLYRIVAVAERDPEGRYLVCHAREEVPA